MLSSLTKVPTIIEYLETKFLEWRATITEENVKREKLGMEVVVLPPATADEFISWCKDYIDKCPAIGIAYLARGFGLRMANGDTVAMQSQDDKDYSMRDEGIHITKPQTIPGLHGIVDTSGIAITGR